MATQQPPSAPDPSSRVGGYTFALTCCLMLPLIAELVIIWLIRTMAADGYSANNPPPMRGDALCRCVKIFKTTITVILTCIAAVVGTTAKGVPQVLVAQNAANLVFVVSVMFGAGDLLPHSQDDMLNGARGAVLATVPIGFFADGVALMTKLVSIICVAIYGCLCFLYKQCRPR